LSDSVSIARMTSQQMRTPQTLNTMKQCHPRSCFALAPPSHGAHIRARASEASGSSRGTRTTNTYVLSFVLQLGMETITIFILELELVSAGARFSMGHGGYCESFSISYDFRKLCHFFKTNCSCFIECIIKLTRSEVTC